MRGIGARNKAVAQHRLGYFQQFHQPKNCRCSVVRTYVQRDRLYKYALTPIPREICNELAAPVQGGSSTRSISQRSDLRFFLSPPYVVGHPCCWKTSLRMKITIRLSLTNSWLIVVVGSLSRGRWEIRGAESTLRRGWMVFFFFINLDIDDKYLDNSSANVFNRNIGCTCAYILFE